MMGEALLPPGDPRHGMNGYTNLGCRCDVCRAAIAAYARQSRAVRAGRLARNPNLAPHGRESTYGGWGCRCRPCSDAWAKATAARRKRRADRLRQAASQVTP